MRSVSACSTRDTGAAGGVHLELGVGTDGSHVFVGAPPEGFEGPAKVGRTSLVYILVDDVDAHHDRATAAGALVVEPLNDTPFGHRRYSCRDPQGHEWSFATATA